MFFFQCKTKDQMSHIKAVWYFGLHSKLKNTFLVETARSFTDIIFFGGLSFVLWRPVTCLFWAERNRLLLALYNVWLKESGTAQFYLGLLCIHMAILRDPASVSQWTPISLQHLPITIALGGKERAQSKQQTQTFSEILQSHRPWFLQICFNEQLWCIP